jgi:hypothetical protein
MLFFSIFPIFCFFFFENEMKERQNNIQKKRNNWKKEKKDELQKMKKEK